MIDGAPSRAVAGRQMLALAALAIVYLAVLGGWGRPHDAAFDPLAPEPHSIEQSIVAGRFAEALPQVEALRSRFPHEWLVSMWLARAHHGLGHARAEAEAWEQFVTESPAPGESCPALPQAYERTGDEARALAAYEKCTRFDPSDPGPFADLGAAYLARGRAADAAAAYRTALDLAPDDRVVRERVASLSTTSSPVARAGGQP